MSLLAPSSRRDESMRGALVGVLAAGLMACASANSDRPSATDQYLRWVAHQRSGGESLLLRWHERQMPLRVYLPDPPADLFEDAAAIVDSVRDGVLDWTDVAGPGVPRFRFVETHSEADIPIVWAATPSGDWYIAHCAYDVSALRTAFSVEHILVTARWGDRQLADLHSLHQIMLHEMGHALGMAGHSPNSADIMFGKMNRAQVELTPRDRTTLRLLYSRPIGSRVIGAKHDR